jgi:hypothetical protein
MIVCLEAKKLAELECRFSEIRLLQGKLPLGWTLVAAHPGLRADSRFPDEVRRCSGAAPTGLLMELSDRSANCRWILSGAIMSNFASLSS